MASEFTTDALDDCRADFAAFCAGMPLDDAISRMCDDCPVPESPIAPLCAMLGVTRDFYFAMNMRNLQAKDAQARLHTGYMPEPARRNVRYRTYCDGLRTPKDRTARDMARMRV